MLQKVSKCVLALLLLFTAACPVAAGAEEIQITPGQQQEQVQALSQVEPQEQPQGQPQDQPQGQTQVQPQVQPQEQVQATDKPVIQVAAADHNPKKYRNGSTARESIEVTIQHNAAFIYSIDWVEEGRYTAPTNLEEKVEAAQSENPLTVILAGNQEGTPVKYRITAVPTGQDESQQTSFEIVVDLPNKSGQESVRKVRVFATESMITSTPASADENVNVNTPIVIKLPGDATLASGSAITQNNLGLLDITLEKVPDNGSNVSVPFTARLTQDNNLNITLTPNNPLEGETKYLINVPAEKIKKTSNQALNQQYQATFTTAKDETPPTVTLTPVDTAADVPVSVKPVAKFNEPIYISSNGSTVPVTSANASGLVNLYDENGNIVQTSATYNSTEFSITLTPVNELVPGKEYKLVVPADTLKDFAGNTVGSKSSNFMTAADTTAPTASFNVTANQTNVDPAANLTITFSETVYLVNGGSPLSTSNASSIFTLKDSNNQNVPCAATYDPSTRILTIDPTQNLAYNASYTLQLLDKVVRDQVNLQNQGQSVTFRTAADTVAPTINSTPADGAGNVLVDSNIVLTFSEPVNLQSSSYSSYVTIRNNTTNATIPFTGTWDSNAQSLTLNPDIDLDINQTYTVTVIGGLVKDSSGNANVAKSFSFTTQTTDNRTLTATLYPANNAIDVPLNTVMTISFNKTISAVYGTVMSGTNPNDKFILRRYSDKAVVPSTLSYDSTLRKLSIVPAQNLQSYTKYELILSANAVQDSAGNKNSQVINTFTTIVDSSVPTATLYPYHGQSAFPVDGNLKITFNKPVYLSNGTEINSANASGIFTLRDNSTGTYVSLYSLAYNPATYELTIDPAQNLKNNTSYTLAVIQNSVRDSSYHYISAYSAVFTTAADTNPPTISFSPSSGSAGIALNTNITLTFSEPVVLQTSDYTSYITIRENGQTATVPFTATWMSGTQSLVIDPTTDLLPNRTYLVSVLGGLVKDYTNNPNIAAVSSFSTQMDYYPPSFTTYPVSGATGVSLSDNVTVTVSEPFTLYNGAEVTSQNAASIVSLVDSRSNLVDTNVTYNAANRTITVDPKNILRSNEEYRIVISANKIKDAAGNGNASFVSTFRTIYSGVIYISSDITNGQTNVPVSRTFPISFSENVTLANGTSITNSNVGKLVTFKDDSGKNVPFSANWDANNLSITLSPKARLQPGTRYNIRIEAGLVQNAAGVKNTLFALTFTTIRDEDLPTVISSPENGEEDIPLDSEINLQFSEPVLLANGSKLTNSNVGSLVQLRSSSNDLVNYRAEWDEENLILTLDPTTLLKKNEAYTIYLPSGLLRDQSNNPVQSYLASFYTIRESGLVEIRSNPQNGDEEVGIDKPFTITFKEAVTLRNNVKITSSNLSTLISLYDENMQKIAVKYEWSEKDYTAKITPTALLKGNSTYSLVVEAGKVFNRNKKTNAGYIVTFRTSNESSPPVIVSNPEDGDTNVSIRQNIEVVFSEPVTLTNGTELSNDNLTGLVKIVDDNGKNVAYKAKWYPSSRKIVLDPKLNLKKNTSYIIYIPAGVVSDLSGNLNEEYMAEFTTAKK